MESRIMPHSESVGMEVGGGVPTVFGVVEQLLPPTGSAGISTQAVLLKVAGPAYGESTRTRTVKSTEAPAAKLAITHTT